MTIAFVLYSSFLILPLPSAAASQTGPGPSFYAQPIDDLPPSVHILTPGPGQIFNDLTVRIAWESEDLQSGVNHTFLRLDSGNWLNVDGSFSFEANLLQGGDHNVTVVVFDMAGNQARDQVDFVVQIAPDQPQSINATAGASGISVSWAVPYDGGSPIIYYKIFRRSGTIGFNSSPIATSSISVYFDANAAAGTKYYYVVKASNSQGDGPVSSEVNATLADGPRPPDAPVDLVARPGMGFVSLSWNMPPNKGGADVVAYRIYRTNVLGANPTSPIATLGNGQRYYIDASLISGEYHYKVSAINFSEGPRSNESSVAVSGIEPGAPGTVVGMSLLEEVSDIRLSWQVPPQGASPIFRYLIYRSITPYDPVFLNFSSTTEYLDTDIIAGVTQHYWIVAENQQGQGPLSAMITGTRQPIDSGVGGEIMPLLVLAGFAAAAVAVVAWMRHRK